MEGNPKHWEEWGRLIVKSWDDETLRQRLLTEPTEILREIGVAIPEGLNVKVVDGAALADVGEDDGSLVLPLPPRPDTRAAAKEQELSDEALDMVVGGGLYSAVSSLPYSGYLARTISPLRVPSSWPTGTHP